MIAIGSDHGGYKLKEEIKKYLDEKEIQYKDYGCMSEESVDYPNIAKEVAKLMQENKVGCIPVCNDNKVCGIVTDRDIILRSLACDKFNK